MIKMNCEYFFHRATDVDFDVDIMIYTYQHGNYIRDAIEGVLSQKTNYKYQMIISDDCSTDGTQEIIEEYQKKFPDRITSVIAKENTNGQFRRGLESKFSNADYIMYCEGDDYWTDTKKIEKQITFLKNHPKYVAVTGNVKCVDEENNIIHRDFHLYSFRESHIYTEQNALMMELASHISAICHRNIMKNWSEDQCNRYFDCWSTGDLKLGILLGIKGMIYYSQDVFGNHRRMFEGTSWTARMSKMELVKKAEYDIKTCNCINEYISSEFGKELYIQDFTDRVQSKTNNSQCDNTMIRIENNLRIFNMWLLVNTSRGSIANYLENKGIHRIAIYGLSFLGARLFFELRESNVEVVYGRERNRAIDIANLLIFRDYSDEMPDVDTIVVTAITDFDEIKESLIKEGYKNIVALDEILYDMIPSDPELLCD